MTALASAPRLFDVRIALGLAIGASACKLDGHAEFDDSHRPSLESTGLGGKAGAPSVPGGGSASGGMAVALGGASAGSSSAGSPHAGNASGNGGGGAGGQAGSVVVVGGAPDIEGGMGGAGGASYSDPVTVRITDVEDAYLSSCKPDSNWGDEDRLIADRDMLGNESCTHDSLLEASLTAIPAGSMVDAATLSLTCLSVGDAVAVSYLEQAWQGETVRWSNRPQVGSKLGTITCNQMGSVALDLTGAVSAWLSGSRENYGVYLSTTGADGSDFASSEALPVADRPVLVVKYRAPE